MLQTNLDYSYSLSKLLKLNGALQHDLCGDEVYGEFFGETNSSPHEVRGAEQPLVFVDASFSSGILNEATVNLVLLAALEQFEDQVGVAGDQLDKALDCGLKGPGFQSHLQMFLFWVHSALPQKLSRIFSFLSFRGYVNPPILETLLKLASGC